jgi:uncharacterized protein DUF1569
MNSLFTAEHAQEVIARLERISPDQKPVWGKMNAAQMMAHCNETMEVARGIKHLKRGFISYVLGSMIKKHFYNDAPTRKNSPTHPTFIKAGQHGLDTERAALITHIRAFQEGGPEKCTDAPHGFFGKITKEQWGQGMYKHMDHHLQQFGV